MRELLVVLVLLTSAWAQPWIGLVAPSRATNWNNVGVVGGIPSGSWSRCTTGTGTGIMSSTSTAAQINTAIAGCNAFHYIELGVGTFNLTTGLKINSKNNILIRGQGADLTLLVFSGNDSCQGIFAVICFQSSDLNYSGGPSNTANWTAGYAQDGSSITLSNVTNLAVGNPATIDQLDDVCGVITGGICATDTGALFICYTPIGQCSTNGDSGGAPRPNRSQQQLVTITSISGTGPYTVGISPPLRMSNWTGSKTPQAWWATNPILLDGLENLSINASTSGALVGVGIFNCKDCWVKGVRTVGPFARSAIQVMQGNQITLQDNYIFKTNDDPANNYGIEPFPASDMLVQNIIFEQVQAPYPANGSCSGCVFAYNFDVNNVFNNGPINFLSQSGYVHAVGDEHILYEGNIGAGVNSDNFHGTHNLQTIFRNYWNGYQKDEGNFAFPGQGTRPVILGAYSRFYNVLGNVLGNCALQTVYENAVGNAHAGSAIYDIGFGNSIPNDANTVTTLMRWGNYDCITDTNRFVSGEVPSGLSGAQSSFANSVPTCADTNCFANFKSFYLTSRPAWWTTGKPWPSIGPEITGGNLKYCVGGSRTGTYVVTTAQCPGGTATTLAGGRVVSNPAMDCYLNTMGGPPDGVGSVLTFRADLCYPRNPQIQYNARIDNCVSGVESDCVGGRFAGQLNATLQFQYRPTDTLPFAVAPPTGPPANTAFKDPDFGAYMVIATDINTETDVAPVCPKCSSYNMGANGEYDAWNLDSTMLLVQKNGGRTWIYSINKDRIHQQTCSPGNPCVTQSRIVTSSTPDTTHLEQGGDWSFSRTDTNTLFEEDSTGLVISKLVINTTGDPTTAWTLARTPYVNFASDSPVPCSVLPANYQVNWAGVFSPANDGSITKAYGGGIPWAASMVVLLDGAIASNTFIYPTSNNASHNGFQATVAGTTGGSQPNWGTTCNTAGSTCTDGGVTWRNIGKLTGQGPGFDIVNYRPGVGCNHVNTRLGVKYNGTGVSEPAGALTSQDDIVCARMGVAAPCPFTDKLTMHEAGQPFNPAYVTISATGAGGPTSGDDFAVGFGSCAAVNVNYTGTWSSATTYAIRDLVFYNNIIYTSLTAGNTNHLPTDPTNWVIADNYCYRYVWQPATTIVNPCIEIGSPLGVGACGGHGDKGYNQYYGGDTFKSHLFSLPSIGGRPNPGIAMIPLSMPGDQHSSGRATSTDDSFPFALFRSEVPTSSLRYSAAGYAEIVSIVPDGTQLMYRFAHNFSDGSSSEFSVQNAIGDLSQDGTFGAFGTNLMNTRGSMDVGGAACNGLHADLSPIKNQVVSINQNLLPVGNNAGADIFQATNAGTETSGAFPNWNVACGNAGEYCTSDKTVAGTALDGTIKWLNLGPNNCRGDVVVIDLLSAQPNNFSPAPAVGFFSSLDKK